jgi:hypothetical protein
MVDPAILQKMMQALAANKVKPETVEKVTVKPGQNPLPDQS